MAERVTRERLERYRRDRAAVDRLARAARRPVADKVRGSLTEYPYTQVRIPIVGLDQRLVRRYQEEKARVDAEAQAIAEALAGMEDLVMADLLRRRYLERKTWVGIWLDLGGGGAADTYRMMVKRFLDRG